MAIVSWGRGNAFTVAYNDLPPQAMKDGVRTLLDDGCKSAIAGLKATQVMTNAIRVAGHPGRELTCRGTTRGSKVSVHARVFMAGSRYYQIMWIGPGSEPVADVTRFLDSVEIMATAKSNPDQSLAANAVGRKSGKPKQPRNTKDVKRPEPKPAADSPQQGRPAKEKDVAVRPEPPPRRTRKEPRPLTEDQKKFIYRSLKMSDTTLARLKEARERFRNKGYNVRGNDKGIEAAERMRDRQRESYRKRHQLTDAQLDAILAEGDLKGWGIVGVP
jgi:hypothetical protein